MMVTLLDRVLPLLVEYCSLQTPTGESNDIPDGPLEQLIVSKVESIATGFIECNMIAPPGITRFRKTALCDSRKGYSFIYSRANRKTEFGCLGDNEF